MVRSAWQATGEATRVRERGRAEPPEPVERRIERLVIRDLAGTADRFEAALVLARLTAIQTLLAVGWTPELRAAGRKASLDYGRLARQRWPAECRALRAALGPPTPDAVTVLRLRDAAGHARAAGHVAGAMALDATACLTALRLGHPLE